MKRASETRAKPRSLAVLALSLAFLAGCEEALSPDGASIEAQSSDAENDGKTELFPEYSDNSRESVEAPEVFQVTEAGLWDGRPSLGGIWVAHPDVTQPERVVIKNTSNNKTVNGALFRRERNLPGPALQLSSAAAEKLGILAGAPTKVEVVALRRKPAEQEKAAPEETVETVTASADETTEAGTAAPDVADKPAKRKWWQKKETVAATTAAGATVAAADAASDATTNAVEETAETAVQATSSGAEDVSATEKPAKRKWWQKKEPVAAAGAAGAVAAEAASDAPAEASEDVVETATPTATLSDPEVTPPTEKPAKRKWWQKKPANEITETPLDPIEGAAAAIDAAEPTAVETAAATQAATPRSISKPYVQVGTFNVEANAKSAAEKIKRNGLNADVRELKSDGNTVWRVLVGPAATRSERNAIQSDVKDLGFTDAFNVKN